MSERDWWEVHADVTERIWLYDDQINAVIRSDYLREMADFLFKPGGQLLDVGCGTGWVGLKLLERGMRVDGFDVSLRQIQRAREQASKIGDSHASYWCADAVHITTQGVYDGIILHSVLHHLSYSEQTGLLKELANLLVNRGRIYIYEPLTAKPSRSITIWLLNKSTGALLRILKVLAFRLGWVDSTIRQYIAADWTMRTPNEQPGTLDALLEILPDTLNPVRVAYWHAYSIAYANFCMMLKPKYRQIAARLAPLIYRLDCLLLRHPLRHYLRCWPMVAIMAEKQTNSIN